MLTEEQLNETIDRIKKEDYSAFELIYNAYSEALYGICLKILKDPSVAEDATQDSFVKIWKRIHSFDRKKGTFFTWMLNINRNTAIDKYRKISKTTTVSIQTSENFVDLNKTENSTPNIDQIGLVDLIAVLPEKQQVIIEYIYFKGYTQQETADALDLPLGTVKTRTRTALRELKELFTLLLTWI